ncbi:MAG: hypothetical protein U0324_01545 [Polyangiales bacterium]
MDAVKALALAALVAACGARTEGLPEAPDRASLDGGGPLDLDASVDRALTRPPRLEAGCDGAPLPAPRSVRRVDGPTRLYPVTLHDPSRERVIVLGGLPASGTFTREVYAVSTVDGHVTPLGQSGVELALEAGVAWAVPGQTALLVGGMRPGGVWTGDVLRVDVTDASVRVSRAGAHPGGEIVGPTAVYDPRRAAVIVNGGRGVDGRDARPFATTWAVRLDGASTRWEALVAPADGPAPGWQRVGGVDPRDGAVILLGGATSDGADRAVWSLAAGAQPHWARLEGAADALPRSGEALPWDPVGCGFVLVGGRCSDQIWLLRPEAGGVREALLGAVRLEGESRGLGRMGAGVALDVARRTLVAVAGESCDTSGATVRSNALIELR